MSCSDAPKETLLTFAVLICNDKKLNKQGTEYYARKMKTFIAMITYNTMN